jgi:hypothetical protein
MNDPETTLKRIKERGYRTVRIRPEAHSIDAQIRLGDLEKAVQMAAVSLRGWDFPHVDNQSVPRRDSDFVEQATDWGYHIEMWRAYKSKQFYSIAALWDDWRDKEPVMWPAPAGWKPYTGLSVEDTVFRFAEIFEFAARWSTALKIQGRIAITVEVMKLENRSLQLGPNRSHFTFPKTAHLESWKHSEWYFPADILAKPRELSIPLAIDFFEKFSWDVGPETIREIQNELRR